MKIRAAVLNAMGAQAPFAQSQPLTIEELELRDPGSGEVLIRVAASGVMGQTQRGRLSPRPTPFG